jgi:uncharacterized protein (TIGR03086 family)
MVSILSDQTGQKVTGFGPQAVRMTTQTSPKQTVANDPRPTFAKALTAASSAIAAVRPDQMANPTPCGTYNVSELLNHLVVALDRVGVVGRGENPFAQPEEMQPADGDWLASWNREALEAENAWADPAVLARPTMLPWAAESGALALRSYIAEFCVHTWDLAKATGQQLAFDAEVVSISLDVMREILPAIGRREMFDAIRATMPEEARGGPDPYAAAVPVAADAPLIEQLVAHVGRRPA